MSAALEVWPIEYSGPLIKIDKHNLPDLDDLMLDVLATLSFETEMRWDWEDDAVTRIAGDWSEASVGFYRKNPCACGDGHGFDLGYVGMDDEGKPVGKAARGAFMGVYFA